MQSGAAASERRAAELDSQLLMLGRALREAEGAALEWQGRARQAEEARRELGGMVSESEKAVQKVRGTLQLIIQATGHPARMSLTASVLCADSSEHTHKWLYKGLQQAAQSVVAGWAQGVGGICFPRMQASPLLHLVMLRFFRLPTSPESSILVTHICCRDRLPAAVCSCSSSQTLLSCSCPTAVNAPKPSSNRTTCAQPSQRHRQQRQQQS